MKNRLSFARLCVEINKDASLPSSIHVDIEEFGSVKVLVEYPWKPKYCSICLLAGHGAQSCKIFRREWRPIQQIKEVLNDPKFPAADTHALAKPVHDEASKSVDVDAPSQTKVSEVDAQCSAETAHDDVPKPAEVHEVEEREYDAPCSSKSKIPSPVAVVPGKEATPNSAVTNADMVQT